MSNHNEKHFLQKLSSLIAILSFLSAIGCIGVLALYSDELTKVYLASFASSAFFFFSVGIVLKVISGTNLPKRNT